MVQKSLGSSPSGSTNQNPGLDSGFIFIEMQSVKIFSGTCTIDLAKKISESFGRPLGSVILNKFSDGEISVTFDESVRGSDVFLIQSTIPPADNLLELMLMIDAAKRASAEYVTVVVP